MIKLIIISFGILISGIIVFGIDADEIDTAYILNRKGELLMKQGAYKKALEAFHLSLNIYNKYNRNDSVGISLSNIGVACFELSEYDTALKYFQHALIIDSTFNKREITADFINIGQVYRVWGRYDSAMIYFKYALTIVIEADNKKQIALTLSSMGLIYESWGKRDSAMVYFKSALNIQVQLKDKENAAISLNNIGLVYRSWGQYDSAMHYIKQALETVQESGSESDISTYLSNMGGISKKIGKYKEAINYYQDALELDEKHGSKGGISRNCNNLGLVHMLIGQYDKAFQYLSKSLEFEHTLKRKDRYAMCLNNLGLLFKCWGQYEKALEYYQRALKCHVEMKHYESIGTNFNNIGTIYNIINAHDSAIKYFQLSLYNYTKQKENENVATALNNLGIAYTSKNMYDSALQYYKKSLAVNSKLGHQLAIAVDLNNIGTNNYYRCCYNTSLHYYEKALEINKGAGAESNCAIQYHNIGILFYTLNKDSAAIANFTESIKLKEKLRKTAKGTIRRDYLESQIVTYKYLINTLLRYDNAIASFSICELSRSKLLAERLLKNDFDSVNIDALFQIIPSETAVLNYSFNLWNEDLSVIIGSTDTVTGHFILDSTIITNITKVYSPILKEIIADNNEFIVPQNEIDKGLINDNVIKYNQGEFGKIIALYRSLLTSRSHSFSGRGFKEVTISAEKNNLLDELAHKLYTILIKPVEQQLTGKTSFIIIPDGPLGFIPFETLINDSGKYLGEKYRITYVQSMTVYDKLKKRRYRMDRKPLLAFGGAVYDSLYSKEDRISNAAQLNYLRQQADDAIAASNSMRSIYAKVGKVKWDDLPNTLTEVKQLKDIYENALVYTDKDVTENRVKVLSESGELAEYKIIHFATHGFADQNIPEHSALVLSQFKKERDGEDGYLSLLEILKLTIKADFVNLSACETGLGRLYASEGIVGLSQAFLLAGANGCSVSLWKVDDAATAQFMVELYKIAKTNGGDYSGAMAQVKRKFIKGGFGGKYRHPYYWAPFVYYGN